MLRDPHLVARQLREQHVAEGMSKQSGEYCRSAGPPYLRELRHQGERKLNFELWRGVGQGWVVTEIQYQLDDDDDGRLVGLMRRLWLSEVKKEGNYRLGDWLKDC